MAKPPKDQKKPELPEIELEPDAWPRFERLIKDIAKAGPKHRTAKKRADASTRKKAR